MKLQTLKTAKKTVLSAIILGSILCMASSCKKPKDGEMGPEGSPGNSGPTLQGNMQGFVQLYDQYGTRFYTKLDSTTISIDGTTTSALTDVNGKYILSNLNTGTYNFSINGRSSFAPSKLQGIELTDNGTIDRDVKLSQTPIWSLSAITAVDTIIAGVHELKIKITLPTTDTKAREVSLYIGSASGVNSTNYIWNYNISVPANATSLTKIVAASSVFLNGDNLGSGSTVYLAVYPAAVGYTTNSAYMDYTTGKFIYNAINMASVANNQVQLF